MTASKLLSIVTMMLVLVIGLFVLFPVPANNQVPACHVCVPTTVQMLERHVVPAPTPVYSAAKQRWWKSEELCDLAQTLVFRGNAETLRDLLISYLAAAKLACAPPLEYNANGINEPCLAAYMDLQTAVDIAVKRMVRHRNELYEETAP